MTGFKKRFLCFFAFFASALSSGGLASIYLNGIDISSALNQDMKSVDIHIDERGNLFITAPHYYVNEAESFVPLSSGRPARLPHMPLLKLEHETPDQAANPTANPNASPAPSAENLPAPPSSPAVSTKEPMPNETTATVPGPLAPSPASTPPVSSSPDNSTPVPSLPAPASVEAKDASKAPGP